MRKLFFFLPLLALVLAGCQQEYQWHARDISGLMPPLQFKLTDENGNTVTQKKYLGKINMLFFGYTHCPDVCPATLTKMGQALQAMPEDARKQVNVLFVSVDPKRDTPQRLKKYTAFFSPQIIGLTGPVDRLHDLTKRYRTTFSYGKPEKDGSYTVNHGSGIYIFDRQGKIKLMASNGEGPDQLGEDLTHLVQATSS